jgi:uncharacterized protein involved in exopolysaccharide biosynthesis
MTELEQQLLNSLRALSAQHNNDVSKLTAQVNALSAQVQSLSQILSDLSDQLDQLSKR